MNYETFPKESETQKRNLHKSLFRKKAKHIYFSLIIDIVQNFLVTSFIYLFLSSFQSPRKAIYHVLMILFLIFKVLQCSKTTCMGSSMLYSTEPNELRNPDAMLEHAKDFLDQYFTSVKK